MRFLCFLRAPLSSAVGRDGARGVMLALGDTTKFLPQSFVGRWLGPAASAWFDANAGLRPGSPLHVDIARVWARGEEMHAEITGVELAPVAPSWRKHTTEPESA